MKSIQTLPETTVSRLRSQVVITSAAQCISELLQNSLDARSTKIEISLHSEDYYISVKDNGLGIGPRDMESLGSPHSTSKLSGLPDLEHVQTFGFRGEALASIAAVSLLTITSRHENYRITTTKRIHNSETIYNGSASTPFLSHGTHVIVQNLFGNLPVRRKMLTSAGVHDKRRALESTISHCKKAMVETILASLWFGNVDISFRVDGNLVFSYSGGEIYDDGIAVIKRAYGDDVVETYEDFDKVEGDIAIKGVISLKLTRSKNHQYIYINNRKLLSDTLQKEINDLMKRYLENPDDEDFDISKHPFYILWISAPLSGYDICQDPSKAIGTLENYQDIRNALINSLRPVLERQDIRALPSPRKKPRLANRQHSVTETLHQRSLSLRELALSKVRSGKSDMPTTCSRCSSPSLSRREDEDGGGNSLTRRRSLSADDQINYRNCAESWRPEVFSRSEESIRSLSQRNPSDVDSASIRLSKSELQHASVISQVNDQFILIKTSGISASEAPRLVLVDQHAADERVRVEKLISEYSQAVSLRISNGAAAADDDFSFRLEHPMRFPINLSEVESLERYRNQFEAWGITYCIDGLKTGSHGTFELQEDARLEISRLPKTIGNRCLSDPKLANRIILRHSQDLQSGRVPALLLAKGEEAVSAESVASCLPKMILELLNSRACRGAIMFGDKLELEKCSALITNLTECEFPFQCAHGRPSMVPLVTLNGASLGSSSVLGGSQP